MTAPRWTIDDNGFLTWHNGDMKIMPWHKALDFGNYYLSPESVAALVRAVQDADTCTQARELTQQATDADAAHDTGGWSMAVAELLNLFKEKRT